MVMRLVRDDDVQEDGSKPQGNAATSASRPRRRSRSASPTGPEHLKMSIDEQLDTAVPLSDDGDGTSDRAETGTDAQEVEPQEQPDGAVAAAADEESSSGDSNDEAGDSGAAPTVSLAAVEALLLSTHHP